MAHGRTGSSPVIRTSSEIPCTAPFSPVAKTVLYREFLRFQLRPRYPGPWLGPIPQISYRLRRIFHAVSNGQTECIDGI